VGEGGGGRGLGLLARGRRVAGRVRRVRVNVVDRTLVRSLRLLAYELVEGRLMMRRCCPVLGASSRCAMMVADRSGRSTLGEH